MCFPNNMEVLLSEEFSLMKNKFTLGAFIRADKPTAHIFRKTQRVSFLTSTRRQLRQRQRSLADICLLVNRHDLCRFYIFTKFCQRDC